MGCMTMPVLPSWARWARGTFRVLLSTWGCLILFRFLAQLAGDPWHLPHWVQVAGLSYLGVMVLCGLLWLVGEIMRGFHEP